MDTVKELLKVVRPEQETILDLEREVFGPDHETPGKRAVKLSVAHKAEPPVAPVRAESPPRAHTFHEVEGFATYLERFAGAQPVVYADVPHNCISAVLNETEAKGLECVEFRPQVHPRWAPWEAALGRSMPIAEFVDLVRNNRRTIHEPEGRELALALSQVKASREITMHQGSGKQSLNGLLVKLNIQGNEKSEHVELPDEIVVHAPIFVGVSPASHALDLILDADEDGVTARLAAGDLQEAKIQAFEEIVETLRAALKPLMHEDKPRFTFTFGAPCWKEWRYLAPNFRLNGGVAPGGR